MNKPDETLRARLKRRVRHIVRRYPVAVLGFVAVYFYFTDCFVAHKSNPELPWIESGVHCGGPFGFVATVAVVVVGIIYCLKKGL
jgi:hypothetical protein